MKTQESAKLLIVPNFQGKTLEVRLCRSKKIAFAVSFLFILVFAGLITQRYLFYRDQVYILLYDYSKSSSSINQISNDGVQTRIDLMRLKTEVDLLDKFIAQSSQMDSELRANLKIPHSSVTFADIFQQNIRNRPSSYPAVSSEQVNEKMQIEILESQERQKRNQELMDRTPSGYPVKGTLLEARHYIHGPGLVICAPVGTLVRSTATGRIFSIQKMDEDGFYTIEIQHPTDVSKELSTRYLYCKDVLVYEGQDINKGQVIAYVGRLSGQQKPLIAYQLLINKMLIQP